MEMWLEAMDAVSTFALQQNTIIFLTLKNYKMKDYGKILEAFYFEILGPKGEILREAEGGKMMAFATGAPGSLGMWEFTDVVYLPDYGDAQGAHTWKCHMKNFHHQKYVGLVWRDKEELYNTSVSSAGKGREVLLTAEPQTDGSYKWRIMISSHALIRHGNDVLASTADRSYRWTMRLRNLHLDYHLESLSFSEEKTKALKTTPVDFVVNGEIQTGEGITVSTEQSAEISKENTFEYGFTDTLAIGATVSAKIKTPGGFAEASAELRVDATFEASQKNVVSTTVTYFTKDIITVRENSNVKIKAWVDWVENEELPFVALFNIRGTAAKADGNSEADTMNTEEVQLVLQEKGFSGQFLTAKSNGTASAKINGNMTGSFGLDKHLSAVSQ